MPDTTNCCEEFDPRIPLIFKATLQNVTDDECLDCETLNGEYFLESAPPPDECFYHTASFFGTCELDLLFLQAGKVSDDMYGINLAVRSPLNDSVAIYENNEIADILAGAVVLVKISQSSNECIWPNSITVEPVPVFPECPYQPPCRPCVEPSTGILPSTQGVPGSSAPSPISPEEECDCACAEGCGGGSKAQGSCGPELSPILGPMGSHLPVIGGPAEIDLTTGSVRFSFAPPRTADSDLLPVLLYDSRNAGASDFGLGFSSSLSRKLIEVNSQSVALVTSDGNKRWFSRKDGGGLYLSAPGSASRMQDNSDGTWTERKYEGSLVHYNSDGILSLENPSGALWTVAYSGTRIVGVESPFGRLVTVTYDGSDKLQSIQDPSGRITTFTVTGGNLTQITTPELCVTELLYDGSSRLQAYVDPLGYRTTYGYDATGLVDKVLLPTGHRTTITWNGAVSAVVQDANSKLTTLLYNPAHNIKGIINPLGQRLTMVWALDQLVSLQYEAGTLSSMTYTITADRVRRLHVAEYPLGSITSYSYQSSGELRTVVKPTGSRSTYTWANFGQLLSAEHPLDNRWTTAWDGSGRPTVLVDPNNYRYTYSYDGVTGSRSVLNPVGYRTTYSFLPTGQVQSVRNPLNEITTYTRDGMNRVLTQQDALGFVTSFTYDLVGHRTSVTNPLGFRSTMAYDSQGRLQAQIDPLGNRTTYTYDGNSNRQDVQNPLGFLWTTVYDTANRLQASIDPLNRRVTMVYDGFGRLSARISPSGARTTTVYDSLSRPQAVIDPLGYRTTSVYDQESRVNATIDALNGRTTTVYDALGRVQATVGPLSNRTTTVYDAASHVQAVIDPLSNRSTTIYDAAGRPEAQINPLGFRTTTAYDPAGRANKQIDTLGNIWTTTYDAVGRAVASVNPLGYASTSVYDPAGRMTAAIDPEGYRTTYTYDEANRRRSVINARGYVATTQYDQAGQTQATINALGHRTTFAYDGAGQNTSVTNALGYITTSTYGAVGQASVQNPLGFITTYGYDRMDRQDQVSNPLGFTTTSVFDPLGRAQATINPLGYRTTSVYDAASRQIAVLDANGKYTTTTYDAASRATSQMNALGYRTTMTYDAASQMRSLINARGYTTTFSYDGAGMRREVIDSLGRITTASYDAAGQQSLRHDPRDYVTTYSYDGSGRLTRRLYPDDSRHTFAFDHVGNREKMEDTTGVYTYTYDELDRPQVTTNCYSQTITYSYDSLGRRATMIEPSGGQFTYSYDAANQLTQLDNPQGFLVSYSYDEAGRRMRADLPLGMRYTMSYDPAGQMKDLRCVFRAPQTPSFFRYSYDPIGNLFNLYENYSGNTWTTYTYDDAYQLLSERRAGTFLINYAITHTYDSVGNHLTEWFADGSRATTTYDAANQPQVRQSNWANHPAVTTYSYDAAGNRRDELYTDGVRSTYTWDYENQLHIYNSVGLSLFTFTYNGDFRRTQRVLPSSPGGTLRFNWDGDTYLSEMDDSNVTNVVYSMEPTPYGALVGLRKTAPSLNNYYIFPDRIGTTVWVGQSGSTIPINYRFQAFGRQPSSSGNPTNLNWIGQLGYYRDLFGGGGGLFYVRRRYFDAGTYQWLSVDPLGARSGDVNPYVYASNRPLVMIDPSGLQELSCADTCCCCVENLSIPAKRIVNIDRIQGIPFPIWGKAFVADIETQWKAFSKSVECKLEWWEKSTQAIPPLNVANKWTDMFDYTKGKSRTFDPWTKDRKKPCPGKEFVGVLDEPSLPLQNKSDTQTIYFAIRVVSAPDCPCDKPSAVVYGRLDLEIVRGMGTKREWTPLDKLPEGVGPVPWGE